jgi:transposase
MMGSKKESIMARERLSMRKISEVLRLSLERKLSFRKIANSCCLARSTVSDYLGRARVAGLGWPLPEGMDEERLDALLFPFQDGVGTVPPAALDMVYIRHEMKRPHVTLQLLWEEYRGHTPDGYSYSQYCQLYRNWLGKQAISLRQEHRAGEKLFIDFAGDTIPIHDPLAGEIRQGHLFVAVLGCSNPSYEWTLEAKAKTAGIYSAHQNGATCAQLNGATFLTVWDSEGWRRG